jgi:chromosome segregation ATPase
MDEQDWLRRIDQHLETSKDYLRERNELMARIDATIERLDETVERNSETIERNGAAFLDLRGYMEQTTTVLGALVSEIRAGRQEQSESWREWRQESRAWRKETRTWHLALSEKLDRLGGGAGPSPA